MTAKDHPPKQSPLTLLLGLIAVALTGTPSYAQQVDWGQLSSLLKPGMTEQQVVRRVGYRPNKVELKTCGQELSSGSWTCKIYTFGNIYANLTILFAQEHDGGYWVVNGWFVSP